MSNLTWAFIDESGNPSLNIETPGTSRFYVLAGVLCSSNDVQKVRDSAKKISDDYFSGSELKSSGIGGKAERREKVIRSIVKSEIKFYALVVDKSLIFEDSGLRFKQSFFKYLNRLFYTKLHSSMCGLSVRADEHGRTKFMEGFKRYLEEQYASELFEPLDFEFVNSESEPVVGFADIIAGTIRRVFQGDDSRKFLSILEPATILLDHWPPAIDVEPMFGRESNQSHFDDMVARQGVLSVRNFIQKNSDSYDPEICLQSSTLKFLLYRFELDPNKYISTSQLLDHLNQVSEEEVGEHRFRSRVIAILRNEGVLIVSSQKGYKIPASTEDITEFVDLVGGQTIPYLRRLSTVRDGLLLASKKEYEIINQTVYPELYSVIGALRDIKGD